MLMYTTCRPCVSARRRMYKAHCQNPDTSGSKRELRAQMWSLYWAPETEPPASHTNLCTARKPRFWTRMWAYFGAFQGLPFWALEPVNNTDMYRKSTAGGGRYYQSNNTAS